MWRPGALLIALALPAFAVGGLAVPTHDLPPPTRSVTETVLKPGETLEGALLRSRLGRPEAAAIVAALRPEVNLRRVQPGERLIIARGKDDQLSDVTFWRSPVERCEIRRNGEGWSARTVLTPVETRTAVIAGIIEGSLFESMDRLQESPALAAKFLRLFEWDFDFAADSLPGDRFRLLVEKEVVLDEPVGYGNILIAQYQSAGRRTLTAVAFPVSAGKISYFDDEGRSIRKMFLRAPLDFTRITSGYSHARRHPILGGVRPHLAVDYAAPLGTPVRAVANGLVRSAGWSGGNGLSVTLRHAGGYETMYNHLSQIEVRRGQHVRQRQVVGRVGSTGLSTGPHLDYRVIKHGRFVNPLDERFIPGAPVPAASRGAFRQQLKALLERLDREALFEPPA